MRSFANLFLETPLFGRPTRKFLWLLLRLTQTFSQFLEKVYVNHPFVKRLNRKLEDDISVQFDNRYVQSFQLSTILKHYGFLKEALSRLSGMPDFVFLVPLQSESQVARFGVSVASIRSQIYEQWSIVFVINESAQLALNHIRSLIRHHLNLNDRFEVCATNELRTYIASKNFTFITVIDPTFAIFPSALAEMAKAFMIYPDADVIYSDSVREDSQAVFHKPDWSPLLLIGSNYIGQFTIVARQRFLEAYREHTWGTMYEILLNLIPVVSLKVRHLPIILAVTLNSDTDSSVSGVDVARREISWDGFRLRQGAPIFENVWRLEVQLDAEPLVSIVIPTKNGFEFLKPCLDSVFKRSTYTKFEVVVVDHQSDDPEVLDYLKAMVGEYPARLKVVRYEGVFNFGKMNNLGINHSQGDYLITLNNDTEILTEDWIEQMLCLCQLPHVGAVGPKLIYPDHTIQHAGVFGCGYMAAGHAALGKSMNTAQYFGYFQCTHEVLAVTAACMMVARKKYVDIGGFDENLVPNGWGDVDFNLKLDQKGFTNVYTPFSTLLHKESKSRGKNIEAFERHYILSRYGERLLNDPYHNNNLLPTEYRPHPEYSGHQPSMKVFRAMLESEHPGLEFLKEMENFNHE